jgi:hypothetical protein
VGKAEASERSKRVTRIASLIINSARVMFSVVNRAKEQPTSHSVDITSPPAPQWDQLSTGVALATIKERTFDYMRSLRVSKDGEFLGYRHSAFAEKPVLYGTLAALLLRHLYGDNEAEHIPEEIDRVLGSQRDDGLFWDPEIECDLAEREDWWGWRHLTLHALMTLSLYGATARKEVGYLRQFKNSDAFRQHLLSRDWGERADFTSNELQNVGVMLQYSRDHHNSGISAKLLEVLFDVLDQKQDPETGLYGNSFLTPYELSRGVQAGYHFWLLYSYDNRPINHSERIIDSVLKTQNVLGGYGLQWNSSACEDIDSIDPLVRLGSKNGYRNEDIQRSLRLALSAILHNLNPDGGWVFRRHEALTVGHPEMSSRSNESNLFYTWFRTLGLAYCLTGLDTLPPGLDYPWSFRRAPGHQFL